MDLTRRKLMSVAALAAFARKLPGATLKQVQLGVTTDEIDEDLLTAAKFLRQYGLGWAEIRSIWGKYNTSQPMEKIHEAKKLLDEHGVKTSVLSTAFFKIPLPKDTPEGRAVLDNQWSLLDTAMERAKVMGTDKLRVFAFTYKAGEKPDPAAYPRIHELLREAAGRARKRGFRLALENVGESYVWSGAEAADYGREVVPGRVQAAGPEADHACSPAGLPAGCKRQDGVVRGGRGRNGQRWADPRAAEGRLQGELYAGDPLQEPARKSAREQNIA
jgi:hypothetical protein